MTTLEHLERLQRKSRILTVVEALLLLPVTWIAVTASAWAWIGSAALLLGVAVNYFHQVGVGLEIELERDPHAVAGPGEVAE